MPDRTTNQPDVVERRERGVTALIQAYRDNLESVLTKAQAATLAELQQRIDVQDGRVQLTARTQNALRGLDTLFLREMDAAGFDRLVKSFTGSFASQIPSFQEALAVASSRSQIPLERLRFTAADTKLLLSTTKSAEVLLRDAVESAATAGRQNALLGVAGIPFRDLSQAIAGRFRIAVSRSEAMAKTSISTYYRMLTAATADRIQQAMPPGVELRFRPVGPLDKLTRPFCRKLLTSQQTYTRGQLEGMDNGQLANPFLTCGGYKCRHVFVVDRMEQAKAA